MRRFAFYWLVLSFGFLMLGSGSVAIAAEIKFPPLTGRVVDQAGVLDPQTVAHVSQLSANLERKTTDQFVVVTLKSLQGRDIADYGYRLGRHWGIGQKGKDNGVILIVVPNEKKVRIEVGYGAEGRLTDALSSVILNQSILPRFKAGDLPGGIRRGAEDIAQVLGGDATPFREQAERRPVQVHGGISAFGGLLFFFILLFIVRLVGHRGRSRYGRGYYRRSPTALDVLPWVLLSAGSRRGGFGSGGGGFSGGGGSFGGGGASGGW